MTALVRLHCNENPYGTSPAARYAARGTTGWLHHYPEPDATALREAIAAAYACGPDRVTVANGSDELVLALATALRAGTRAAAVTAHTFPGYVKSLRAVRQRFTATPLAGWRVDVDTLLARIRSGAHLVFVCHPHNPTGRVLDAGAVARLCDAADAHDTVMVFDEAYAEFADPPFASALPAAIGGRRVLVLRTMSKAYGLAGLRLGYAIGDPSVLDRVRRVLEALPFRVNRVAQRAAMAALADHAFIADSRRRVAATRDEFCRQLDHLGVARQPTQVNFVLVDRRWRDGDLLAPVSSFARVRRCDDMDLPHHLRISIGTDHDMKGLISVISDSR
jgi:histidinol-phosphate aminotransferase